MVQSISPAMALSNSLVRRMSKTKPVAAVSDWWSNLGLSVAATQNIDDVEYEWRALEERGISSPGQSFDFTKTWIERFQIPKSEQLFVTGSAKGRTVALMPLRRSQFMGGNVLSWFSGDHVGCESPLVDKEILADLEENERAQIWTQMQRGMFATDLVILDAVPEFENENLFSQLGEPVAAETLYRSEYESWEACERSQRSRTRRKHDKQQGAKLAALGKVSFEILTAKDDVEEVLRVLFRHKAIRFEEWGIENPFVEPNTQQFYKDMFFNDGSLTGKLHVLRLDDEIVAVRYNLVHGKNNFALISSMSDDAKLRPGSPGKQNVLRAMREIFKSGYEICDMGKGFSDEKRHWCNRKIALNTHYLALTNRGRMMAGLHRVKPKVRQAIKSNQRLFSVLKSLRAVGGVGQGRR